MQFIKSTESHTQANSHIQWPCYMLNETFHKCKSLLIIVSIAFMYTFFSQLCDLLRTICKRIMLVYIIQCWQRIFLYLSFGRSSFVHNDSVSVTTNGKILRKKRLKHRFFEILIQICINDMVTKWWITNKKNAFAFCACMHSHVSAL